MPKTPVIPPSNHPYWRLDAEAQLVAQMYAAVSDPTAHNVIKSALDRCGFRKINLPEAMRSLRAANLIRDVSGQGLVLYAQAAAIATRHAISENRFLEMVEAVNAILVWHVGYSFQGENSDRTLRRSFRAGYYMKDTAKMQTLADRVGTKKLALFSGIVTEDFKGDEFDRVPGNLGDYFVECCVALHIFHGTPVATLIEHIERGRILEPRVVRAVAEYRLVRGEFNKLESLAQEADASPAAEGPVEALQIRGVLEFLKGNDDKALATFETAMAAITKVTRRRKVFVRGLCGIFFLLALIRQRTPDSLKTAATLGKLGMSLSESHFAGMLGLVRLGAELLQLEASVQTVNPLDKASPLRPLEVLLGGLVVYWTHPDLSSRELNLGPLADALDVAVERKFSWVGRELAELLSHMAPERDRPIHAARALKLQEDLDFPCRSFAGLISRLEAWERSLHSLEALASDVASLDQAGAVRADRRLVWLVERLRYHGNSILSLKAVEQSITKSGQWGKGRAVGLHRLLDPKAVPFLTNQDRAASTHIVQEFGWNGYGYRDYDINIPAALYELAGAPNVMLVVEDETRIPLEIVRKEIEVLLTAGGDGLLTASMEPSATSDNEPTGDRKETYFTIEDAPARWLAYRVEPEHRRLARIFGKDNKLVVPESAKERLVKAVAALSSKIKIHSEVSGAGLSRAEPVPADPRPHFHLLPHDQGLRVEALARPIPEIGSHYAPGRGGKVVFAREEDRHLQTERDLDEEKGRFEAALVACSTLENHAGTGQAEFHWIVDHPEACLELLSELHAMGDDVVVAWPQGETYRLKGSVSASAFRMSIRGAGDWFSASGELQVDEDLVLSMKQIMALLDDGSAMFGRFVKLSDGQFLALSREFRKRMEELRAFTTPGKGDTLRIHPLAAYAVNDLAEESNFKAGKEWRKHLERLKEAENLEPEIPSTLQAELRSYQVEGFRWLARLAHWGVGACLADDMGLGKTVQALALLLRRAPGGPALVLAPMSVVRNWIKEAQRFAPTLNITHFGIGDREGSLANLGPFDLVLCSYGLLPIEAARLSEVSWHSIILDEAQAIKNAATQRSRTAMKLRGDFRLITTGTPIENNLGELHNLFQFINPGLLGSLDSFNTKFADPIERRQDDAARLRLKKLIQPFLLRRLKNQVLDDLPSRTEIVLTVEMSPEERAFYEALRQNALESLESDASGKSGERSIRILAEITRLRRACCNPSLIRKTGAPPSAKLATFATTLEELLSNKHKVLVFSQFVDHLAILRKHLESEGISYQYLDGSTPGNARQKRIDAFQAGDGDVFLISLKAGGMGLNLTAADYVIHMDPWWNPAVEDQASDRAHRIGQRRPVTIYRLVTRGTIEEKIVELHHTKRDLADRLLEGTDASTRLSAEDMLALLREEV